MKLYFAGHVLDCERFELRNEDQRIDVQPKVFSFLRFLAEQSHRTVSKDEILDALWPDAVVAEGSLQRLASLARGVLNDVNGEILRTVRGVGYQLDVPVRVEADEDDHAEPNESGSFEQAIRYCRTVDGVNIAWSSVGEGPPLVRSLGWFTNLEREWAWPVGRRFWEKLASGRQLIRYDGRGTGLSDSVTELSQETRLRDLEAVLAAADVSTFDLLGLSEGCASALLYTVRNPKRVRRLILFGPQSHTFLPKTDEMVESGRAIRSMLRLAWGGGSPFYGRLLAALFVGESADAATRDYFDRMQRASTDKEGAIRYIESMKVQDLREEARKVSVPTLVVHRRDDHLCEFRSGREAATLIPGARFVPLPGDNHWPLSDDPGADLFIKVVDDFLRE